MAVFAIHKSLAALPTPLAPHAVYAVRVGTGFDLYITDATGQLAFKHNTPSLDAAAFATATQGLKAETAHGWGNHAAAGYLTSADLVALDDGINFDAEDPAWDNRFYSSYYHTSGPGTSPGGFYWFIANLGGSAWRGLQLATRYDSSSEMYFRSAHDGTRAFGPWRKLYHSGNLDPAGFASAAQGTKAETAHSWGNHAAAGYLSDPAVFATAAQGLRAEAAHGWGDHAAAGYAAQTALRTIEPPPTRRAAAAFGWTGAAAAYPHLRGGTITSTGAATYQAALAWAHRNGARLPRIEELEAGLATGTGGGYDADLCWSMTEVPGDPTRVWGIKGNGTGARVALPKDGSQTARTRYVANVDAAAFDPLDPPICKTRGGAGQAIPTGYGDRTYITFAATTEILDPGYSRLNDHTLNIDAPGRYRLTFHWDAGHSTTTRSTVAWLPSISDPGGSYAGTEFKEGEYYTYHRIGSGETNQLGSGGVTTLIETSGANVQIRLAAYAIAGAPCAVWSGCRCLIERVR